MSKRGVPETNIRHTRGELNQSRRGGKERWRGASCMCRVSSGCAVAAAGGSSEAKVLAHTMCHAYVHPPMCVIFAPLHSCCERVCFTKW